MAYIYVAGWLDPICAVPNLSEPALVGLFQFYLHDAQSLHAFFVDASNDHIIGFDPCFSLCTVQSCVDWSTALNKIHIAACSATSERIGCRLDSDGTEKTNDQLCRRWRRMRQWLYYLLLMTVALLLADLVSVAQRRVSMQLGINCRDEGGGAYIWSEGRLGRYELAIYKWTHTTWGAGREFLACAWHAKMRYEHWPSSLFASWIRSSKHNPENNGRASIVKKIPQAFFHPLMK